MLLVESNGQEDQKALEEEEEDVTHKVGGCFTSCVESWEQGKGQGGSDTEDQKSDLIKT